VTANRRREGDEDHPRQLRRAHAYFWEARGLDLPGRHWAQRRSYYLDAFQGDELRRPKVLIIARSPKRADNIWRLAMHFFREVFTEDQLVDFMEVVIVDQAVAKLRKVVAHAEASERPAEMPWVRELRATAAAATKANAEAAQKAKDAAIAHAAVEEKRRLEIEDLRRQEKWKTHEKIEREQREAEEAFPQEPAGRTREDQEPRRREGLMAHGARDRLHRRQRELRARETTAARAADRPDHRLPCPGSLGPGWA
jgi:hypothetical protein